MLLKKHFAHVSRENMRDRYHRRGSFAVGNFLLKIPSVSRRRAAKTAKLPRRWNSSI